MKQHPTAWVIWVGGAAVCALLTRNPLYLAVLALSAALVLAAAGEQSGQLRSWLSLLRLGAVIWLLTIPFNALMLHQGQIVLFKLPTNWPLVGGNITLEAMLYGAAAGLAIWTLLLLFASFNTTVDASELLRMSPPLFYQASLITSIGLTFFPQMIKSAQEIREAQRVRGHRFRTWRDLTPLVIPLLTTSLERAMQLAESMEARGFGGETNDLSSQHRLRLGVLMLTGLALVLVGLVLSLWWRQRAWPGSIILAAGIAGLGTAMVMTARHIKRSHYNRLRWRWPDTVIAAGSLAATAVMVAVRLTNNLALTYYPFPPSPLLPRFNPWLGLMLALFALPGLLVLAQPGLQPQPVGGQSEVSQ